MDTLEKLRILGGAAKYDVCAATGCSSGSGSGGFDGAARNVVCHSFTPDGRCVSLFRVLMTNNCVKDCFYCPNRVQRDVIRTAFRPEELAKLFMEFYRRNYVEGLFLSSGIPQHPSVIMNEMLKTVELLRFKYNYKGYIHLKVLPGADFQYVERATQLATRVSVNMEAPSEGHLAKLSRTKGLEKDIVTRMNWIRKLSADKRLPAGQTTQYIIGAAGESDTQIMASVRRLYEEIGLRRAYFSAFQPIPATPLEMVPATPLIREHRLYQADILVRQYRFKYDELAFKRDGNLPTGVDPKMAIALKNVGQYPVEINKANYSQLLRVPGIGQVAASRIIKVRQNCKITGVNQLKSMGVVTKRAVPFLTLNGSYRAVFRYVEQLALWGDENEDFVDTGSPFAHQSGLIGSGL